MRSLRRAISVFAVCAAGVWAGDSSLAGFVDSSLPYAAGVDVRQLKQSAFGKYLLGHLPAPGKGWREAMEVAGFDITRDLDEIVITADVPSRGAGLVLVKGTFRLDNIVSAASAHGAVTEYRGKALIRAPKSATTVAILDPHVIAIGPDASVRSLVERQLATAAGKATELSGANHVWMIANGSPAEWARVVPNANLRGALTGDLLQTVDRVALGLHFGDQVTIQGEANLKDAKNAAPLIDVARFLLEMARANGGLGGGAGQLLSTLEMKPEGSTIRFSMKAGAADFERLFESGEGRLLRPAFLPR